MKILVFSDSHGGRKYMDKALESHPDVRDVIFLGDGASDIEKFEMYYPEKQFYSVAGNCDFYSHLPEEVVDEIEGKRFFACHGHTLRVKYGIISLAEAARSENASVALYGHTHRQDTTYRDGLLIFNPGSVRYGEFGAIDVAENGILPVLLNLD